MANPTREIGVPGNCPICGASLREAFTARVLGRHEARYEFCASCGYMRVANPDWLDEAYSSAIAVTDTGVALRNVDFAQRLSSVLYWAFGARGNDRFLDAAAGYGLLVRLMRDFGFDFYWDDPYCENLLARGFEFTPDVAPCAAVTAIEIMEHVEDPLAFVRQCLSMSGARTFIFSTGLFEGEPPPRDWWYYSFDTGQHISFYQRRTLELMAQKLGLSFVTGGGLHAFTDRKISPLKFRMLAGPASGRAAAAARRRLSTRVMTDHQQMVQRLRRDATAGR